MLRLLLPALLLTSGLAAAQPSAQTPAQTAPQTVEVTHEEGTTRVPRNPRRVVFIGAYPLQFAFALKTNVVVGLATDLEPQDIHINPDRTLKFVNGQTFFRHGDLGRAVYVGTDAQPSLERIAQLKPDLIVRSWWPGQEGYAQLSRIAPTLSLDETRPGAWEKALKTYARVFGKEREAQAVIDHERAQERTLARDLAAAGVLKRYPQAAVLSGGENLSNYWIETGSRLVPVLERLGFRMGLLPAADYRRGELGKVISQEVLAGLTPGTLVTFHQYRKEPMGPVLQKTSARVLDYVIEPYSPWIGPYAEERYLNYLRGQLLGR